MPPGGFQDRPMAEVHIPYQIRMPDSRNLDTAQLMVRPVPAQLFSLAGVLTVHSCSLESLPQTHRYLFSGFELDCEPQHASKHPCQLHPRDDFRTQVLAVQLFKGLPMPWDNNGNSLL